MTSKKKRCIKLIRARGKWLVTPEKHTITLAYQSGTTKGKKMINANKRTRELENEITRLENILLEKESTIKYLNDQLDALWLENINQRNNFYKSLDNCSKQLYYPKNQNNKAIYEALIFIIQKFYIKPLKDWKINYFDENKFWDEKTVKLQNDLTQQLIDKLIEERNLNND